MIEGIPDLFDMQKLVAELRTLESERGIPPLQLDPSKLTELLDYTIESNTARLRLEQEWKAGVIPTAPATVVQASELGGLS